MPNQVAGAPAQVPPISGQLPPHPEFFHSEGLSRTRAQTQKLRNYCLWIKVSQIRSLPIAVLIPTRSYICVRETQSVEPYEYLWSGHGWASLCLALQMKKLGLKGLNAHILAASTDSAEAGFKLGLWSHSYSLHDLHCSSRCDGF